MYSIVTNATLQTDPDRAMRGVTADDICKLAVMLYCNSTAQSQSDFECELLFDGYSWVACVLAECGSDDPFNELVEEYEVVLRPDGVDVALRQLGAPFIEDGEFESAAATTERYQELIATELPKTEMELRRERAKRAAAARKAKKN